MPDVRHQQEADSVILRHLVLTSHSAMKTPVRRSGCGRKEHRCHLLHDPAATFEARWLTMPLWSSCDRGPQHNIG